MRLRENHLGHHAVDPHPQNHSVILDMLQVFSGIVTGAHIEEQEGNRPRAGEASAVSLQCSRS